MLSSSPEGALLKVRVVPGAKRSGIAGEVEGRLKLRLAAPPVEGKANRELVRFLAGALALRKRRVLIAAGERSRSKTVLLEGLTVTEARARLKKVFREE